MSYNLLIAMPLLVIAVVSFAKKDVMTLVISLLSSTLIILNLGGAIGEKGNVLILLATAIISFILGIIRYLLFRK